MINLNQIITRIELAFSASSFNSSSGEKGNQMCRRRKRTREKNHAEYVTKKLSKLVCYGKGEIGLDYHF